MLQIDREKLQILPDKKVIKRDEYSALIEVKRAMNHAYSESDKIIQYTTQLCEQLVQDTNIQVKSLIDDANKKAQDVVTEANDQVQDLIAQANKESQEIINDAQSRRDEIFEKAKNYYSNEAKRGYQEGYNSGKREIVEQLTNIALKQKEYFTVIEKDLVKLVEKTVQKVIGDIDKKDLITNLVHNALKAIKNEKQVILKVSPQDSEWVRTKLTEILKDRFVEDLEICPDSRLVPGTCVFETGIGVIDASLDVQIDSIFKAFSNVAASERE